MRVLFVTAYYPPCHYGWGYMRICEQVADGLVDRGHQVAVLTSTYRHGPEVKPYRVYRRLPIDPDWAAPQSAGRQFFFGRKAREREATGSLQQIVADFQPDVIFVWHAHGLPRVVLQSAESMAGIVTIYYFANYLPEMPDEYIPYWQALPQAGVARIAKSTVAKVALFMLKREGKPIRLKYEHSISVSHYVRQRLLSQGLIGPDAVVIPNGVDFGVFKPNGDKGSSNRLLRCTVAGRVAPEKGIHTLLRAFGLLHQSGRLRNIHLTIIGDGPEVYKAELAQIANNFGLQDFVHFEPPVAVDEMPGVYDRHDVLLLPSEWHEPLSCTMLEAMASGLLVIGTPTGGSGEVLFHGETGLIFEAGSPASLAEQIAIALDEPDLVRRLAIQGQQRVEQDFDMQKSIKRIEAYLRELVAAKKRVRLNGVAT